MRAVRSSRPDLDDPAFAAAWRARARGAGPFLSWDWIGCEAGLRFPDPVLIELLDDEKVLGTALFNRRRDRLGTTLHLHESGDPALDAVFIEHNGVLAAPDDAGAVWDAVLREALRLGSRVVLSGVGAAGLRAAGRAGAVGRLQPRAAPFRDLGASAVPSDHGAFDRGAFDHRAFGRSTGAQLRRSARAYPAVPRAERARSPAEAAEWLEALLLLHERSWRARGVASGFLAPAVLRFHRALLGRGTTAELVRVSAGTATPGYLLNLREGDRVCNYQGGFDYEGAPPHAKPGLSCHVAAMGLPGTAEYDFLAGDDRYKRNLSNGARELYWLELCRPLSVRGALAAARRLLRPPGPPLTK